MLNSDTFSDALVSSRHFAKDKRVFPTALRLSSVDYSSSAPALAPLSYSKDKKKSKGGASGAGASASNFLAGAWFLFCPTGETRTFMAAPPMVMPLVAVGGVCQKNPQASDIGVWACLIRA